jgi:hypothetical protein
MPEFLFLGVIDTFPVVRDALEQTGVGITSTSTVDNVLHVETDSDISGELFSPITPEA